MNYKGIVSRARIISSGLKKGDFFFLGEKRFGFSKKPFSLPRLLLTPKAFIPSVSLPLFSDKIATLSRNNWSKLATPKIHRYSTNSSGNIYTNASGVEENFKDQHLSDTSAVAAGDRNVNQEVMEQKRPIFPFTAIVGQEEMKLALLLNVIDPKIGGVMIMGDRGTGKSTTVRALVDLLPNIEVVENDPFNSHPSDAELMSQSVREQVVQGKSFPVVCKKTAMIDLPLGATEDRVCGTIDIEKALSEGVKAFEPGLLAKANRGILYVDEVNLLDDHLVDILLDSAASGWNTVEREGISISHPARFILVGSGNPEEGELRPQLLDRFGMHAQIGTVREAELRVKIVEERASFDKSPIEFLNGQADKQKQLADKIVSARHLLGAVKIDYDLRVKISQVCGQLNVDGLRGDIVTNRASQALAAFEARTNVTPQDIFRVIPFCLRHRLRKDPLEPIDSGDRVRDTFKQVFGLFSE